MYGDGIPHDVVALFYKLTFDAIAAGRRRFGAGAIIERMRWYFMIEQHNDTYKINNDWGAELARRFMEDNPDYFGFFELRPMKRSRIPRK